MNYGINILELCDNAFLRNEIESNRFMEFKILNTNY